MKTTLKRPFVAPNDPVLTLVAPEIPVENIALFPPTMESIDEMLLVALGEQKDPKKPLLVGLAAPQIGISKRIILVDVIADGCGKVGDLRVFINPVIKWRHSMQDEWYEGCFSTSCVCGIVSRPCAILVSYYNEDGVYVTVDYSGYTARIIQHEIDHLDGKEFTTHIIHDDKLHWVEKEQFPEYRNNQGWRNWPHKCTRARWNEIKGIK